MLPARNKRIESIDLLRGTVMIIMALDHVRDYFHKDAYLYDPTDLAHTSAFVFFTRWITHFCAPVFTFLAGVSARLQSFGKSRKELSFFLMTRGIWLMLAELLIVTLGWTFNPFYSVLILQVIWAIGVSMVSLSLLIRLPQPAILAIGLLLIFGHNLLDGIHVPGNTPGAFLWSFLHDRSIFTEDHVTFLVGYPVLPWIGIMAAGYSAGELYHREYDPARRKRVLIWLGLGAIATFILIRAINIYGDRSHWSAQDTPLFTLLSFLNTTKYPPSLLYILMTLGPALLFLAFGEVTLNRFTSKVAVFGRVPMFYYVLHIFLIHALAIVVAASTGYRWQDMVSLTTWVTDVPGLKGYGFSLPIVYLIWIGVMIVLYPFSKRYDIYKRSHREKWWLSYF